MASREHRGSQPLKKPTEQRGIQGSSWFLRPQQTTAKISMPQDVINCLPGGPGGHAVRPTQRSPLQSSGKQPGRGLTPLFPPVGGNVDPGEKSRPRPPLPSVGVRPPLRLPSFTWSSAAWGSVWAGGPRPGWADGNPLFPGLIPQLVTLRALWPPHPEVRAGRWTSVPAACRI